MSSVDLYALLKIPSSASDEEVRDALTREQRFWSRRASNAPNLEDRQEAEQHVAQLSVARKTLLDGSARSQYDSRRGPSPRVQPRAPVPPLMPTPPQVPTRTRGPAPFRVSPEGMPPHQQEPYEPQKRFGSGGAASFGQRFLAGVIDGLVAGAIFSLVAKSGSDALGFLALLAYYVLLEGSAKGAGLGKRALRIQIVDADTGGPIGWRRAIVRQLGKYVSGIAFGIGYLWMLWDPRAQTWHDKFAKDVVVSTK